MKLSIVLVAVLTVLAPSRAQTTGDKTEYPRSFTSGSARCYYTCPSKVGAYTYVQQLTPGLCQYYFNGDYRSCGFNTLTGQYTGGGNANLVCPTSLQANCGSTTTPEPNQFKRSRILTRAEREVKRRQYKPSDH